MFTRTTYVPAGTPAVPVRVHVRGKDIVAVPAVRVSPFGSGVDIHVRSPLFFHCVEPVKDAGKESMSVADMVTVWMESLYCTNCVARSFMTTGWSLTGVTLMVSVLAVWSRLTPPLAVPPSS